MYDREEEINTIEKLLCEGRHIQVCGPRKVGKTVILDNLNNRIENPCYYLNCETSVANSPDSIANNMKRLFHTNTPREAPGDPWKEVMYEVFEHLKGRNDDCIIIIDELSDALDKMPDEDRHDFLDILLRLPNEIGIQLIICGSIGLEKILEDYDKAHDIRTSFVPLLVKPFDECTARGFIEECFIRNGLTLSSNILSVLTESIISCFGRDSPLPIFLERFTAHVAQSLLESHKSSITGVDEIISGDGIHIEINQQQEPDLTETIIELYDNCLKQVIDVHERKSTGGGPLQDLIGYIHLIEGDLIQTGGLSKDKTRLVTRLLLSDEITPIMISSLREPGIEEILKNLCDNHLLKHSNDNYIPYLKFLGDVWARLYPLEGELEEKGDEYNG